jgi:hypothetical protein
MSTSASPVSSKAAQALQDLPFWYLIIPTSLTALQAGVIASVTIDNDADFEWRWIIGSSTGSYTVQLTDRFTARPLQSAAVNNVNIVGTAQLPFILPKPYILRRTSTIQASFTDTSGGMSNAIQFALVGYKLAGS